MKLISSGWNPNRQNYYNILGFNENEDKILTDYHNCFCKFVNVGAGVGGGFKNTKELCVMKYNKAVNGLEGVAWKAEVKKEHQQMESKEVFDAFKMADLPKGTKVIDTTWAMKKKSSGTLRGRVNAHGFKQIGGQHYNHPYLRT